jgi:hypothetical protein
VAFNENKRARKGSGSHSIEDETDDDAAPKENTILKWMLFYY